MLLSLSLSCSYLSSRYKSAAENRKNLRIVAALQLVYHMMQYIFMEVALAGGLKVRWEERDGEKKKRSMSDGTG